MLTQAYQPWRVAAPTGGLTIDLFGIKLSQSHQLPPQVPRPRLSMLVDTFLDLSQQFRQGGGRPGGIVPFWLPIRWCEPGMKPQQVRPGQTAACLQLLDVFNVVCCLCHCMCMTCCVCCLAAGAGVADTQCNGFTQHHFGRIMYPVCKHNVQNCARCWRDLLIWRPQVPENVRVERRDETGPAGKLQGVHRDFLLLLLYYPYKEGCVKLSAVVLACACFTLNPTSSLLFCRQLTSSDNVNRGNRPHSSGGTHIS